MSWEKTVRPWFTNGSWLGSQARIAHPEPGFKSRTGRKPYNTLDDLNLHGSPQKLTGHYWGGAAYAHDAYQQTECEGVDAETVRTMLAMRMFCDSRGDCRGHVDPSNWSWTKEMNR